MDTLIRNTTQRFSRRVEGCYEYLDNSKTEDIKKKQMVISRSKNNHNNQRLFLPNGHHQMVFRFSYRRERARQRHIFLQTYKLTSMDDDGGGNNNSTSSRKSSSKPKKLKRAVIKLKSAVISVLSFLRADHTIMGSSFSCTSKSAISVTSPTTRINVKCC